MVKLHIGLPRVPGKFITRVIFYYPTLPGYPKLEKSPGMSIQHLFNQNLHFQFNNSLCLCSSVEFASNRKMTTQSYYQRQMVNGDVTSHNIILLPSGDIYTVSQKKFPPFNCL